MRQSSLFSAVLLLGFLSGSIFPVAYSATLTGTTWGSPDRVWGARREVTEADKQRVMWYHHGHAKLVFETSFQDPKELASDWSLQTDDNRRLKSCRLPENVSVKTGVLKLRTTVTTKCKAKYATGSLISNFKQKYGFIEASIKPANVTGINNAFWMCTEDGFEIDIAEVHYPATVRTTLHNHNDYEPVAGDNNWTRGKSDSVGFNNTFKDNFSESYHSYGVLWTPTEIFYEVDGKPINILVTNRAIKGAADIRFSTAVMEYAGKIPVHPENHDMTVNSLRIYELPK
jgi:beta-glucanase (GH16 family)